jgi:hypothetical protein
MKTGDKFVIVRRESEYEFQFTARNGKTSMTVVFEDRKCDANAMMKWIVENFVEADNPPVGAVHR